MIINLLINFIVLAFGSLFVFLPVVTISSIPLFGSIFASTLLSAVQVFNTIMETFPYGLVVWNVFLYVIAPFEFLMLVSRFFLGARTPVSTN